MVKALENPGTAGGDRHSMRFKIRVDSQFGVGTDVFYGLGERADKLTGEFRNHKFGQSRAGADGCRLAKSGELQLLRCNLVFYILNFH